MGGVTSESPVPLLMVTPRARSCRWGFGLWGHVEGREGEAVTIRELGARIVLDEGVTSSGGAGEGSVARSEAATEGGSSTSGGGGKKRRNRRGKRH